MRSKIHHPKWNTMQVDHLLHCILQLTAQAEELRQSKVNYIDLQKQMDDVANEKEAKHEAKVKSLKETIEGVKKELETVTKERDNFKVDFEKTLQQLTEVKAELADLKATKDELMSAKESLEGQNKVFAYYWMAKF